MDQQIGSIQPQVIGEGFHQQRNNIQSDGEKEEERGNRDQELGFPSSCSSENQGSNAAAVAPALSISSPEGYKRDQEASAGGTPIREKVCRICYLGKVELDGYESSGIQATGSSSTTNRTGLVDLGCACKDELGISHYHCARAWFTLKGTRRCEICGETVKNIDGIEDLSGVRMLRVESFSDRINRRLSTAITIRRNPYNNENPSTRIEEFPSQMCIKSSCNILLTCLLLAFFVPWLFGVHKLF